jgi:hypothetical protein
MTQQPDERDLARAGYIIGTVIAAVVFIGVAALLHFGGDVIIDDQAVSSYLSSLMLAFATVAGSGGLGLLACTKF